MNSKEKKIAAILLSEQSENLAGNSCNDVPKHYFEGWSEEEKIQFGKELYEYHKWDFDPEDFFFSDWALAEYLSHKLMNDK